MRETFTTLQTTSKNYTQQQSNTDATFVAFLKKEINLTLRDIYAILRSHLNIVPKTASTVADRQYYYYPPDIAQIESVAVTINSVLCPLEIIHSQDQWNFLNAIEFAGTAIPQFFFPRRDDFGIWPIPQGAYTMTLNHYFQHKDLSIEDYTTGTITATNNSATITGSGTTFTAAMVGRFLKVDDDGYWYRVKEFTSTTSITLDTVFQGTTASGASYTIGESPSLPSELHHLIPHRVASKFYLGYQKDEAFATYHNRMFWTGDADIPSSAFEDARGGMIGAIKRYAERSDNKIIRKVRKNNLYNSKLWGTTLSL